MKFFAAPWVGEFGWELMNWQGHLRARSQGFDDVIVASRTGHKYLYEDFCTEYIEFNPKGDPDMEVCGGRTYNDFFKDRIQKEDTLFPAKKFLRRGYKKEYKYKLSDQKFIPYGTKSDKNAYDLVIHARNTNKCRTGIRNWPKENWMEVVSRLKGCRIACIGTKKAALHIPGTADKRDLDLRDTCNILRSSRLTIGPSSGPMHLASLCLCSHIVFTDNVHGNRDRYEKDWNPFGTKAIVIDHAGWTPPIKEVWPFVENEL